MDLIITARVTKPDGGKFHSTEQQWNGIGEQELTWYDTEMAKLYDKAQKFAGKKEDDKNLSVVFIRTLDGVATETPPITGVSLFALNKFNREYAKVADKLVGISEKRQKSKK